MQHLMELEHLCVSFATAAGSVEAVRDVSFSLDAGQIFAVVGESGCGKSTLCKSLLRLLPQSARVTATRMCAGDTNLLLCSERQMRQLRGSLLSLVLQDPAASLDPTLRLESQIAEAITAHGARFSRETLHRQVLDRMARAGIDEPEIRCRQYPHQLSGGLCQRAALAIALAAEPKLLIADEPTTCLDVTVQAQILELLLQIRRDLKTAILLVTHDLGVVAQIADLVAVMYAGKFVEVGTTEEIFYDPRHPYTWSLLLSLPSAAGSDRPLRAIPGAPPTMICPPEGDAFAPRNPWALAIDYEQAPPMFRVSPTHFAATWLLDERAPKLTPPVGGGRNG